MDEQLRELERAAAAGDQGAQESLGRARARAGILSPLPGNPAKHLVARLSYDPDGVVHLVEVVGDALATERLHGPGFRDLRPLCRTATGQKYRNGRWQRRPPRRPWHGEPTCKLRLCSPGGGDS